MIVTEKTGKLSNGQVWTYQFGGRVDLLAKDDPANCVMVTHLNTTNDEPFEDDVWDKSFDPMFGGNKKLRAEYDSVCWDCYIADREGLETTYNYIRKASMEAIKGIKKNRPHNTTISEGQFNDIYADVIDMIETEEGWNRYGDEQWLIGTDGIISSMVDEQLEDYLNACGFVVEF